ncbi:glycosyltransferase family 4 protein [Rhodococcus sp. BP-149]|uniref:glycosyltransferase family 4 protein n=1 Tax=unclassified Rhodococcus (in: high G+C Gram-positive bacteria) TaxID=192944 RepID=UPI001C9B7359|nr:glycosyltransferase family 4 protein [Rhodococcus sp. BP-288]MBY6695273.1 glycosyltransferase family 4 protein [Rhodococcus sp. BP-188]MBY6700055.1 glycosyltransferase family 4 protein [Rhodococcus sp. BP-285]MBY6704922.1 glycosyltransferase family 4 protein [Rhodococcus sp. BP-283]MBY6713180.1 glycosyltransferase family 4 protein [Rhodococcus sp. BP-160]MBY6715670.1 glycosyltransferase family 4 protein [Rhodococcus sp. BP-110]MBY6721708.1 glycosyltransferase family 4 protein [Rhodococcus 
MRIAVVHSFYRSDNPSGENTVVRLQVAALERAGHEVALITKDTDDYLDRRSYPAIAALTTATGVGPDPSAQLAAFAPDVVHVHNLFPNWGTRWVRKWRGPIIATLHNYRTVCSNGLLWRDGHDCHDCPTRGSWNSLRHRCYQDSLVATLPLAVATRGQGKHSALLEISSRILTLNADAYSFYSDLLGGERVRLLPNFTDARSSAPAAGKNGFVFVGRLTEEKGIRQLLRQWPSDRRLSIIGTGPEEESIRETYRHHSNIQLLGRLDHQATIDHVSRAFALVIPSLWTEGLPTVALEALAVGTPLLLSNKISAAGLLTSGGAGVIFGIDDGRDDLARALERLISGSENYQNAASRLHANSYSSSTWIESIELIYREAVRSNSTTRHSH